MRKLLFHPFNFKGGEVQFFDSTVNLICIKPPIGNKVKSKLLYFDGNSIAENSSLGRRLSTRL